MKQACFCVFQLSYLISWHRLDEPALTIFLCISLSFLMPQHLCLLPAHTYLKPPLSLLSVTLASPFSLTIIFLFDDLIFNISLLLLHFKNIHLYRSCRIVPLC